MEKPYVEMYVQTYTCENGAIAKMVIPENATEADLKCIKEMVNSSLRHRFNVDPEQLKGVI